MISRLILAMLLLFAASPAWAQDITTGLTARWEYEGGTPLVPSVGPTLTNNNAATFIAGREGNCAHFVTASSQSLSCASTTAIQGGNSQWVICFWVKFNALPGSGASHSLVTKDSNVASSRDYTVDVQNTAGTSRIRFYSGSIVTVTSSAVTTGVWYHVCACHDSASDTMTLWLDAVSQGSPGTGGAAPNDSAANFRIGARDFSGFQDYASADIDSVRFYRGRGWTTTDAAALMAFSATPNITTAAQVRVDEGQTAVTTMAATGDAPITWSVHAGEDAGLFLIGSSSGVLTFDEEPFVDNGEPHRDYEVIIRAANASGTDDHTMTVRVMDAPPNIFTDWSDWLLWKDQRIAWIETQCPSARATTYYYANQGNDTTGDGSIGNPWATRAKAISMTAANTRHRFKCGDRFESIANWAITVDNVTVDSYDSGAKPMFDGFTENYLDAANLWTNASGNRWTLAETDDIGWLRLTADPLGDVQGTNLIRVASSAACGATTNSWFWGSNVLHVNLGVFSPNDVDLEAVVSNGNNGVEFQGTGCRLEGIAAHGFGLSRTDTATQDQPFTNRANGDKKNYFKDFEAYYSGSHVVAHYTAGSGGLSVWNRGLVGYPKYNAAGENGFNSFSNDGGAETFAIDVDMTHGCLKSSDWDYATEKARGSFMLSHTNGVIANHMMVAFDCDIRDSHTPANVLSNLGGCRDPAGDYTQVRSFLVNCTMESLGEATKQFPSINFFPSDSIVYGCDFNLWPTQAGTGAFHGATVNDCWVGNTLIKINGSSLTDWALVNTSPGPYGIELWHCGIWEDGSPANSFAFDYLNKFGNNSPGGGTAQNSSAVNTIFSFNGGAWLGLTNGAYNAGTGKGITNNAYWNVTADVGDERGRDADPAAVILAAKPGTTGCPSQCRGAGSTLIPDFSHDFYGNTRVGVDIGPFATGSGAFGVFGGWIR